MDEMFRTQCLGTWVKNCYIFTRNCRIGVKKLKEIIDDKCKNGGIYVERYDEVSCDFSDGEHWRVTNSARGRRWDKCIVDINTITIEEDWNIKSM